MNSQLKTRLINLGIYENGMSTHSLRHTFATRCIESGMQAVVLSKLLGHSDIRITLNTYVKIFNEYQAKASQAVEEYYKNINLINEKKDDDIEEKITGKIIQFPRKIVNGDFDR